MDKNLKQASQNHYKQFNLSEEQLQTLSQIYEQNDAQTPVKTSRIHKHRSNYWKPLLIAASFLLSISSALYYPIYQKNQLIMSIAEEVTKNHIKMKPLDIHTQLFTDIRQGLDKLDFIPSPSTYYKVKEQILAGARYCSIKSVTAAQLRFTDQAEQYQTLYQVPYDKNSFGEVPSISNNEQPLVRYVKGVKVEIWRESGLMMVSTQNTTP